MRSLLEKGVGALDPPSLIRSLWHRLSPLPGGRKLFSRAIGTVAPYSGTVGAEVMSLEEGRARVRLEDRRAVRNHLGSIHAIALMNLGELATGLATMSALPEGSRSILTGLSMDYLKKARGTLHATAEVTLPGERGRQEMEVVGEIRNAADEVVAVARARWLVDFGG